MKFTADVGQILHAVSQVSGATGGNNTESILRNLLLTAQGNTLIVNATNGRMQMTAYATIEGDEDGKITVPAKKLQDILKSAPKDANIFFSVKEDESAHIRFNKSRFKLSTIPHEAFPLFDALSSTASFTIQEGQLRAMLEAVAFSMASEDVRYYLNGMLFEVAESTLRLVSTDGHRLSTITTAVNVPKTMQEKIIVPREAIAMFLKIIGKTEEDVVIRFNSSNLAISSNGVDLITNLIDGRYPDYTRVIPLNNSKKLSVDTQEFLSDLKQVAVVSDDKFKRVHLDVKDGKINLSMISQTNETAENELDAEYHDEEVEVGFNVNYLMDVFSNIKSDTVDMLLENGNTAAKISPENYSDTIYVVMPMR